MAAPAAPPPTAAPAAPPSGPGARGKAKASTPGTKPGTPAGGSGQPAGGPDDSTGGRFWAKGQGQRIKSDIAGDAKRYAGKLPGASDPAGAIAGILAYALIVNGIRYGPAGLTGWVKAKFLNQPMQGQAVNALAPTQGGGTISA